MSPKKREKTVMRITRDKISIIYCGEGDKCGGVRL